jgi:hypothetical protein
MRLLSSVIPLVACTLAGQTSNVPYNTFGDGQGPTFYIVQVEERCKGTHGSIRRVDFRNLDCGYSLKNGKYKRDEPDDHEEVSLDSFHYLPAFGSSRSDSALVLLSSFEVAVSSSGEGIAEVFKLSGGQLRIIQTVRWDTHFDSRGAKNVYDPTMGTLVVHSAHYIPGDAHCCVSAMDTVTFKWNGTRFVEQDLKTELSGYGKSEGKTLPRTSTPPGARR